MALCELCKRFDIGGMLQQAFDRPQGTNPFHNRSMYDDKEYHSKVIEECFRHQRSLAILLKYSESGCQLCTFLWRNWLAVHAKSPEEGPTLDSLEEDPEYQGQIYIGCYAVQGTASSSPRFFADRHVCSGVSEFFCADCLCEFEAFTDEGKLDDCPTSTMSSLVAPETKAEVRRLSALGSQRTPCW